MVCTKEAEASRSMGIKRRPAPASMQTFQVILLLMSFIGSGPFAEAGVIQLPQTGQKSCYEHSSVSPYFQEVPCYGTGQDGDWQTGAIFVGQRFTVGTGAQSACVTDNQTGLMWMRSPFSQSSWDGSLDYADSAATCDFTDWRIPAITELHSLTNPAFKEQGYWTNSEWLNSQGFTGVGDYPSWSSTTHVASGNHAWYADMWDGGVKTGSKTFGYPTMFVRNTGAAEAVPESGQKTCFQTLQSNPWFQIVPCAGTSEDGELAAGVPWPAPRFTRNSNGTVTDNLTGLIWLENAECFGVRTWAEALWFANNLRGDNIQCLLTDGSRAGDWRLPNYYELFSLLDFEYSNPAVSNTAGSGQSAQSDPFLNLQSSFYWSSSSVPVTSDYAKAVSMGGATGSLSKAATALVWPVRGGQSGSSRTLQISKASGVGTVTSTPSGAACGTSSTLCSATFPVNSDARLYAVPATGGSRVFAGWTGDCNSKGMVTMHADKKCTAAFSTCSYPVRTSIAGGGAMVPYTTIGAAYIGETGGASIEVAASNQAEILNFLAEPGKSFSLIGGYDCAFSEPPLFMTAITGSLTISTGSVTISNFIIQ